MAQRLQGKTALIVGGSGAIGQATARILAAQGATVIIGFNSSEAAAMLAISTLPSAGHQVVRIDIGNSESIAAAAQEIDANFGQLDILVNASGTTKRIPHDRLNDLTDAIFDEVMRLNVRAVFSVIRAFVPLLSKGGAGCIVNVSSTSAKSGRGSNIAYCASKAALDNLGLTLARVLGPRIRILTVSPGAVDSSFVAGRSREELDRLAQQTAMRAVVKPEDVASSILASITLMPVSSGAIITVDGCPL